MLEGVTPNYLSRLDGADLGPRQALLHVSSRLEPERVVSLHSHMFTVRIDSPLFSHTLFGVYMGLIAWTGLYLRDPRVRAMLPLRS